MKNAKLHSIILLAGALVGMTYVGQAADVQTVSKRYPFKTCLVSGEKLNDHQDHPCVFIYAGQELKLCCKCCLKEFKKTPAAYLKKLAAASPKSVASDDTQIFLPISDPYLDAILH